MVSNVDLGFLALTLVAVKRRNHKKKKRRWSKDWYKMRNRFTHQHLLIFLSGSEPEDYRNFLRMDQESFDNLLDLVRQDIEKKDTKMRKAIPASQRLSVTLRYLASGMDLEDLKFTCAIAPQTLELIIMETCSAIIKALKEYIQVSIQWQKLHLCGGSIVAAKWVLTASACITRDFKKFKIRYGVLDCYEDNNIESTTRKVVDQKTSYHVALSLLMVDKEFDRGLFRAFAKLPSSKHNIRPGDHGLVFGWDTGPGQTTSLLNCAMFYIQGGKKIIHKRRVRKYEFKARGNGTGITEGNIGSPLVSENTIYGIASDISTFNGSSPDIFYRVPMFVEWIRNTTRPTP